MKDFESFLFFRIASSEFPNKSTNMTDVICKSDAAEGFNED
jgi:hypothetical protein